MAKTAQAETAVQVAANKARDTYAKAKDANEKNDNANTQATLAKAKDAMKEAVKAENRERFMNVGKRRTLKARAAILQLVKVANPKGYDFTPEEGKKIVAGLVEAVKKVETAFASVGQSGAASDDWTL